MEDYDYIICGAGASGLSLAYHILQSEKLKEKTILLIDKDEKLSNDRTWCFWSNEKPSFFESITSYRWQEFGFYTPEAQHRIKISPFEYYMIKGIDYYNHLKKIISESPQCKWVRSSVDKIDSEPSEAIVTANGKEYSCRFVFSSLWKQPTKEELKHHIFLLQHFKGLFIKTEKNCFDPALPVFMDFRVKQRNHPTFMYLLPFSENEALLEYTLFSPEILQEHEYEDEIKSYLQKYFQVTEFQVTHTEKGAIPMTDYQFPSGDGKSVINIGSSAGMSKATTGYTFYRIQKHSQAIVKALEGKNHPSKANLQSTWKLKMDRLMLHLMLHEGNSIWYIFQKLFENNPPGRVLSFLNEESSYLEDLMIMGSVPSSPFIKALYESGIKL